MIADAGLFAGIGAVAVGWADDLWFIFFVFSLRAWCYFYVKKFLDWLRL